MDSPDCELSQSPKLSVMELENLISGKAIEKRFGKKPSVIRDPKVWDEVALLLAHGVNNSIVHWSPDIVILGGTMMFQDIPIKRVIFHLKNILHIFPKLPPVKMAKLKDYVGLWGALALARQ